MNAKPKMNFVVGLAIRRLRPEVPSAFIADRSRMTSITTVMNVAAPNSTGREKKIVNSCTEGPRSAPNVQADASSRGRPRAGPSPIDDRPGLDAGPPVDRGPPGGGLRRR